MKYVLLLTLLLTPHILNNVDIIDLDHKERKVSKYISHLEWITNKEVSIYNTPNERDLGNKVQKEDIKLGLTVGSTSSINLSSDIPSLTIVKKNQQLNYSLTYDLSQECLLFNHPDSVVNPDIQCRYRNSRYTTLTKTFINKNYKKEVPIAKRYVIGLTDQDKIDVGHIIDNQLFYGYNYDNKRGVGHDFRDLKKLEIKEFFVGDENYLGKGTLYILTENDLVVYKYQPSGNGISFQE
jgi:hypothetical protein